MLRIRLQRRGKRNLATYRIVVAEQSAPIKGRFLRDLGFYNPHTDEFKVRQDEVAEWMRKGAKPSDTVHNLMVTHGVIQAEKVTSWRPKKKQTEKAPAEQETAGQPKAEETAAPEKTEKSEAENPPPETDKDQSAAQTSP